MPFKLYGVPLSQPFRAVAWTLLQQKVPFEVQLTVPGATSKIGSLNENFLSKTAGRTGRIPVLQVPGRNGEPSWTIAESPAILTFLCERRGADEPLYAPPATREKTLIDSYMHWHHEGTRQVALLVQPLIRPDLNMTVTDQSREMVHKVLETLDGAWLKDTKYLASNEHASIADILAYEEIAEAYMTDLLDLSSYPRIKDWVESMQELPYHAEAHAALTTLGSLATESEVPMMKRLGAATKAGMKAFQEAQASY